MGRTVISAAQVRDCEGSVLEIPAGAVVTPLARDVAAEIGVCIKVNPGIEQVRSVAAAPEPGGAGADDLSEKIRAIVTAMVGADSGPATPTKPKPVKLAKQADATLEPFGYPGPGPDQQVLCGDVITAADGPLAVGYLTLTKGSFPWTLSYDEVQIVLEGELHIGTEQGVRVGKPGDVLYVPKGSSITFGTPSWAKFVYVTFPADWEAQIGK
jgi:ethanolamine utilization protein EutQ